MGITLREELDAMVQETCAVLGCQAYVKQVWFACDSTSSTVTIFFVESEYSLSRLVM